MIRLMSMKSISLAQIIIRRIKNQIRLPMLEVTSKKMIKSPMKISRNIFTRGCGWRRKVILLSPESPHQWDLLRNGWIISLLLIRLVVTIFCHTPSPWRDKHQDKNSRLREGSNWRNKNRKKMRETTLQILQTMKLNMNN